MPESQRKERIQKIIAHAGICSRRKAEELIVMGRVTVNGNVAKIGESADTEKDEICVNGEKIYTERKAYYLLNKPKKIVVTKSDPQRRMTIYDLPSVKRLHEHVMSVGRLDYMTEGALLLTNDGEFANRIAHPRYEVKKTYFVRVEPIVRKEDVYKIRQGMIVDGVKVHVEVLEVSPHELILKIHEGRNRIIRNLMEELGYKIFSLKRVAIGPVIMDNLKPGGLRALTPREIMLLTTPRRQTKAGNSGPRNRP